MKYFANISLAYWIMDDGYFYYQEITKSILLCTESITKSEYILLQSLLNNIKLILNIL